MPKVSLSVTSQATSGKDQSKTIGYINPTATNEQLRQTSILFNALSQNTYDGATKTVKSNVNDPEQITKTTAKISIQGWQSDIDGYGHGTYITYTGDGTIKVTGPNSYNLMTNKTPPILLANAGVSGVLYAEETANYSAAALEFTAT